MSAPPRWVGDLNDDCTARWCGFTLRAENMGTWWWWAVYDNPREDAVVVAWDGTLRSGASARGEAERAARKILTSRGGN